MISRRDFLIQSLILSGSTLTSSCIRSDKFKSSFNPNIKSFVNLYMLGGPSQIDLFDYKPELYKKSGMRINRFLTKGGQLGGKLLKPISKFSQHGNSGAWVSDLLPNIAKLSDDITFLKSVTSPSLIHLDAQMYSLTGSLTATHPYIGSWIHHGLNYKGLMPSPFIMTDSLGDPRSFPQAINQMDLPHSSKQIQISSVKSLSNELNSLNYKSSKEAKKYLNLLAEVNKLGENFQTTASHQFQTAYLIQEKFKYLTKKNGYDTETQKLYGVNKIGENHYADQLILARHLIENESPYIQIFCGNEQDSTSWDHHFQIKDIVSMCKKMDRATYGFIQDLKNRSLFDQTLILWGGEFGRLPFIDEDGGPDDPRNGRPHNNMANTMWLSGGGIKKGITIGETDELSLKYADRPIDQMEIWATVMHLLGLNHKGLHYFENGHRVDYIGSKFNVISEILS